MPSYRRSSQSVPASPSFAKVGKAKQRRPRNVLKENYFPRDWDHRNEYQHNGSPLPSLLATPVTQQYLHQHYGYSNENYENHYGDRNRYHTSYNYSNPGSPVHYSRRNRWHKEHNDHRNEPNRTNKNDVHPIVKIVERIHFQPQHQLEPSDGVNVDQQNDKKGRQETNTSDKTAAVSKEQTQAVAQSAGEAIISRQEDSTSCPGKEGPCTPPIKQEADDSTTEKFVFGGPTRSVKQEVDKSHNNSEVFKYTDSDVQVIVKRLKATHKQELEEQQKQFDKQLNDLKIKYEKNIHELSESLQAVAGGMTSVLKQVKDTEHKLQDMKASTT